MWSGHSKDDVHFKTLLKSLPELLFQFLLEPLVVPEAVTLFQQNLSIKAPSSTSQELGAMDYTGKDYSYWESASHFN